MLHPASSIPALPYILLALGCASHPLEVWGDGDISGDTLGEEPSRSKGVSPGDWHHEQMVGRGALGRAKTLAESWQQWLGGLGMVLQLKRGHERLRLGSTGAGRTPRVSWEEHGAMWHLGYSVMAAAWLRFGRVSITPWHGHRIPLWASHSSMGIAAFHRHCTLAWALRAIAGIASPCGHCTLAWASHPIAGIALCALHPIAGIAPHCGHHTPL